MPRPAHRRRWWLGALAAVLLPLLAAGVAVATIDPNDYKPQIIAAVLNSTGRELSLGGTLRISRSLWPTIEVNDVKLANLPGGSRADMARAERIEAQLSLLALLWRRIEVTKLTLIGPNILFEQVDGKPNWVFKADDPAPAAGSTRLRFRSAHVQNGMVTFHLPARTKVVGIRALDFSHATDAGPLEVGSVLVYSDYAPLSLRASATPTGAVTDPWNTVLDFAAYDTAATARGTMNLAGDYDLQVDATAGALEKLNALLPDMQLPALHQMQVATHISNGPTRGDLPVVGATRLHIGSVNLADRVPGLTLSAVTMDMPKAGGLAALSAIGSFAGQAFKLGGTLGVPAHPDGKVNWPVDVRMEAVANRAGSVAVNGRLALETGRFAGLDAAIAVRTPAMAAWRAVASPLLPELTDVALDARLAIPADSSALRLTHAKLATQAGDLAGDVTIGLGPAVAVKGKLVAGRLDFDAWVATLRDGMSPATAPGAESASVTLPWALLRGPTIDLTLDIAKLIVQGQPWSDINLAILLDGGRLRLALPGAPFDAVLAAQASSGGGSVDFSIHAPEIPFAALARQAALPGAAAGAVRVQAQLQAAGQTLHELAASLDGAFAVTMIDGRLKNAALIKLTSGALEALSIKVPAVGETQIRCLGLVGAFSKGVGRLTTIAVDTTYLELSGVGQVDLGAETLALKLNPLARVTGSPVAVPVVVEGPFAAIKGRLDADGLDKIGLLIDGLFGGDRPQTCSKAGLAPTAP